MEFILVLDFLLLGAFPDLVDLLASGYSPGFTPHSECTSRSGPHTSFAGGICTAGKSGEGL